MHLLVISSVLNCQELFLHTQKVHTQLSGIFIFTSLTWGGALRYMIPSSCTLGPNCSTRKECQSWYTAHSVEFIQPNSNMFRAKTYLKRKRKCNMDIRDKKSMIRRSWNDDVRVHEFTDHCRWNVHTPEQQRHKFPVTEQEVAAAVCAYGSYKKMSERCRTSVWGLHTSFAAGWLLSGGKMALATGRIMEM